MGTCGGYIMECERLDEEFIDELDDEVSHNDSDNTDITEETLEDNNFRKKYRLFQRMCIFLNALILCGCIYINHFTYNPSERELLDDNLFSGRDIIVEQDELDDIISVLEDELNISIPLEDADDYYLFDAVMKNTNLNDSEKMFFYKYIDIIKDNPYLDKEEAYRSLLNVDISYKNRPIWYDKTVQGVYIHDCESIGIFNDDEEKSTLAHEIIHCIYCNDKTVNLPKYFKEGMTELLTNEYFSDSPFVELENYPFEIAAVKMLCELTSSDTVLKAFSLGDMNIIANGIACVTGDLDGAVKALEMLDYAFLRYNDELKGDDVIISDPNDIINQFIPTFRECITSKYEENDRRRISYFYNEILFVNIFYEEPYECYVDDLREFGSDHKAYFSSKLKQIVAADDVLNKIGEEDDNNKIKTLEK